MTEVYKITPAGEEALRDLALELFTQDRLERRELTREYREACKRKVVEELSRGICEAIGSEMIR